LPNGSPTWTSTSLPSFTRASADPSFKNTCSSSPSSCPLESCRIVERLTNPSGNTFSEDQDPTEKADPPLPRRSQIRFSSGFPKNLGTKFVEYRSSSSSLKDLRITLNLIRMIGEVSTIPANHTSAIFLIIGTNCGKSFPFIDLFLSFSFVFVFSPSLCFFLDVFL
jgi:hypothetical protein